MRLNESIKMPKVIEADLDKALEITWDDFTDTSYEYGDPDAIATFDDVFGNFISNSNIHRMLLNNIKLCLSAIKYLPLDVLYAELEEEGFHINAGYRDLCGAVSFIYLKNYADMHRDEFEEIVSASNDLDAKSADIRARSGLNYESLRRNKRISKKKHGDKITERNDRRIKHYSEKQLLNNLKGLTNDGTCYSTIDGIDVFWTYAAGDGFDFHIVEHRDDATSIKYGYRGWDDFRVDDLPNRCASPKDLIRYEEMMEKFLKSLR